MNLDGYAFVAIGSNLGDSVNTLRQAVQHLARLSTTPLLCSSLWESTPVDCPPGSANFVNAVIRMIPRSNETPESLLQKLQAIEAEFGRGPKKVINEPRPLDLDLIAFGSVQMKSPKLTIPHPRAHLRRFVLEPLAEIAAGAVLPGQHSSNATLLAQLQTAEVLRRIGTLE